LTVIYDNGHTKPLAPLLKPFLLDQALSDEKPSGDAGNAAGPTNRNALSGSSPGPDILKHLLPLRSAGMQVGDLAGTQLKPDVRLRLAQGNPRPFFLLGSDPVSLQWLAIHRDTLISISAVGMLVQADTEHDVRQVANIAEGLSITLGSGSDLASVLGIYFYPVLITREGITQ
jgi:integrating conjugative element protein (TIGR03765 family)